MTRGGGRECEFEKRRRETKKRGEDVSSKT
jgi:hypothetical protein